MSRGAAEVASQMSVWAAAHEVLREVNGKVKREILVKSEFPPEWMKNAISLLHHVRKYAFGVVPNKDPDFRAISLAITALTGVAACGELAHLFIRKYTKLRVDASDKLHFVFFSNHNNDLDSSHMLVVIGNVKVDDKFVLTREADINEMPKGGIPVETFFEDQENSEKVVFVDLLLGTIGTRDQVLTSVKAYLAKHESTHVKGVRYWGNGIETHDKINTIFERAKTLKVKSSMEQALETLNQLTRMLYSMICLRLAKQGDLETVTEFTRDNESKNLCWTFDRDNQRFELQSAKFGLQYLMNQMKQRHFPVGKGTVELVSDRGEWFLRVPFRNPNVLLRYLSELGRVLEVEARDAGFMKQSESFSVAMRVQQALEAVNKEGLLVHEFNVKRKGLPEYFSDMRARVIEAVTTRVDSDIQALSEAAMFYTGVGACSEYSRLFLRKYLCASKTQQDLIHLVYCRNSKEREKGVRGHVFLVVGDLTGAERWQMLPDLDAGQAARRRGVTLEAFFGGESDSENSIWVDPMLNQFGTKSQILPTLQTYCKFHGVDLLEGIVTVMSSEALYESVEAIYETAKGVAAGVIKQRMLEMLKGITDHFLHIIGMESVQKPVADESALMGLFGNALGGRLQWKYNANKKGFILASPDKSCLEILKAKFDEYGMPADCKLQILSGKEKHYLAFPEVHAAKALLHLYGIGLETQALAKAVTPESIAQEAAGMAPR